MNAQWHSSPVTRRHALGLGAAVTAGAVLAGCGGGTSPSSHAKQKPLRVPAYKAAPEPDGAITSTNRFVPLAFDSYPGKPYKSVPKQPGSGGSVSACLLIWGPAPPPLAKNPWAQELDKRLGTEWKPTVIPAETYDTKVAAILASGNIPDISWIQPDYFQPMAQAVQQGAYVDLSDILAGDGIKKYPNLANVPTYLWERSSIEGAIYGVPRPLYLLNKLDVYRADWAEKLGYPDPPKDSDEMREILTAFSKGKPAGKTQTWGIAAFTTRESEWVGNMFRVPNVWDVDKAGKFTYYLETDEYEASLEYLNSLWKAGVFHPDALLFQTQSDKSPELFTSGRTGFHRPAPAGWLWQGSDLDELMKAHPDARPELLLTPGHGGQKPLNKQTNGWWGIGSISAQAAKDEKKLDELLRIMDYWAAPFGSEEYTFLTYGIEGRHYTLDDRGNPVQTSNEKVISELNGNYFINPSETTLYYPGTTDRAKLAHDYFEKQLEGSIPDPSLGLVSETNIKKVSSLTELNTSYENDIVSGRKPLSAIKEWRSRWKSQGGEAIRKEYEESLQRSKSKK